MAAPKPRSRGKIVVFGIIAWYPLAGVVYQCLHYLNGLRRLGYDPYYVEDSLREVYDPSINDYTPDASRNVEMLAAVLREHGYGDRWAFRGLAEDGRSLGECAGMTDEDLRRLYREADACLNITGGNEIRDEHLACARRIYVESDPFSAQVRLSQGDKKTTEFLARHDMHFSFGENLGAPDCTVPIERFCWLPTRQPVDLELWQPLQTTGGEAFTTVTTWHNKTGGLTFEGETYHWTKDREFLRFIDLPRRRHVPLELAATVDDQVRSLLTENGWRNVDSVHISRDVDRYRAYIQQSRGEFTVARDQYARPRTGWFSDRSACYLAAGRPVITQETGFSKVLPTGKGLFAFSTMDDILAAIDTIEGNYAANCAAAREIAAEYFAAERVVGSLMARAGLA